MVTPISGSDMFVDPDGLMVLNYNHGREHLSEDDGPLPKEFGLRPCDDTVCCPQNSFKQCDMLF